MRKIFTAALLIVLVALPCFNAPAGAFAPLQSGTFQDFGYVSVFKVERWPTGTLVTSFSGGHMKGIHNIQATVADVPTYEGCEFPGADYLAPADAADSIADLAADYGFRLMLNLQWVLFQRTTSPCDPVGSTRLRPDWEQRLVTYAQRAAGRYNSSNTAYMIIHSEVVNSPQITQVNMNTVSRRAKELFPGIPAAAGYPTTDGAGPLPSIFPWPLDIIFTWDYSVADPNAASYINGDYANLLSRLRTYQSIGVVIEGFGGDQTGISGVYLGTLARRWCQFAKQQPRVDHIVGFFWGEDRFNDGGTDDIIHLEQGLGSTGIVTAHRAVANAALNQLNGSCLAN